MKFLFSFRKRKSVRLQNCELAIKTIEHIKQLVKDPRPGFDFELVPHYFTSEQRSSVRVGLAICVQHNFIPESGGNFNQRAREFIMHVRLMTVPMRNAVFFKLASCLFSYLDSSELKEYQYDRIVQEYYSKIKEKQ